MTTSNLKYADPGETHSKDAKRFYAWKDFQCDKRLERFLVEDEGQEPRTISVSKNKKRVLVGLINGPVFAASYCRISDQVLPLRRDYGLDITCTIFKNDPETGRDIYGVYTLESKVTRIDGGAS
jgi:hypothetical protein